MSLGGFDNFSEALQDGFYSRDWCLIIAELKGGLCW